MNVVRVLRTSHTRRAGVSVPSTSKRTSFLFLCLRSAKSEDTMISAEFKLFVAAWKRAARRSREFRSIHVTAMTVKAAYFLNIAHSASATSSTAYLLCGETFLRITKDRNLIRAPRKRPPRTFSSRARPRHAPHHQPAKSFVRPHHHPELSLPSGDSHGRLRRPAATSGE